MNSDGTIRKVSPANTAAVLMYHSIADDLAGLPLGQSLAYSVRQSDFDAQLSEIKSSEFSVINLTTLMDANSARGKSTVLTFDDGSDSDYERAFPALLKASCSATFFLSTANIGSRGYMSWSQVREMQGQGMEFGTHAHDHIPLTSLSKEATREQLHRSKAIVEERIGRKVTSMSAPFGFINHKVESIAKELGYRVICTSSPKMARWGVSTVPRVAVMNWTTIEEFRRILLGDWRTYFPRMIKQSLAYVPRHLLLHFRPFAPGIRKLKSEA